MVTTQWSKGDAHVGLEADFSGLVVTARLNCTRFRGV